MVTCSNMAVLIITANNGQHTANNNTVKNEKQTGAELGQAQPKLELRLVTEVKESTRVQKRFCWGIPKICKI